MDKKRMLTILALLILTAGISSAQLHENVEQVGRFCNYWYSAEAFEISGRYVYIAAGVSGLQILEIRDKLHPVWAGAMEDIPYYAKGIAVEGNYVYLADIRGGLVIIDVGDPRNLITVNTFELPADVFLNDVDVKDGMAYLSTIEDGLRIVDVSDPLVPVEVGIIEGRWYNGVDFCGDYAFAICENAMNILGISVLPDLPLINSVRLLPITESITIFKRLCSKSSIF